jgi:transformation/transcription domain-associated protein
MIHVIQNDYELLSVIAIRIIFDLYKYYRTTISNEYIQTFLDFVIALYRNLPYAIQQNFRKENLIIVPPPPVSAPAPVSALPSQTQTTQPSSSISSSHTAAATPMDIDATAGTAGVTNDNTSTADDAMEIDNIDAGTTAVTSPTKPNAQEVMDIIDHSFDGVTTSTTTVNVTATITTTTSSVEPVSTTAPEQPMDTTAETSTTTASTTQDVIAPNSNKISIPASSTTSSSLPVGSLSSTSFSSLSMNTSPSSNLLNPYHNNSDGSVAYRMVLYKSTLSFQVLTECPLIVMLLMFQLYPQQYVKSNILTFIQLMMDALSLRPPPLPSKSHTTSTTMATAATTTTAAVTAATSTTTTTSLVATTSTASVSATVNTPTGAPVARSSNYTSTGGSSRPDITSYEQMHMIRARELIAAQAKTLSFLTYLLRTFVTELKPYEDTLAANVVALMSICPRDAISTRKELLVATRHMLNSDFRTGFYKHIDSMIDERVLMGGTTSITSNHRPDPTIIRPLAYTTLADFLQHARSLLSMTQMSKVICLFSRILHDTSVKMPLTTQFIAVRAVINVIDIVFNNKDPDPQIGRDILVRLLNTMVDKLHGLNEYYPEVLKAEQQRNADETATLEQLKDQALRTKWLYDATITHPTTDTVREVLSLIRTIIVSQKNIVYYLCNYRIQRVENAAAAAAVAAAVVPVVSSNSNKDSATPVLPNNTRGPAVDPSASLMPPPGSNEEVSSALLKLTYTEIAIIDRYIMVALASMKVLSQADKTDASKDKRPLPNSSNNDGNSSEKAISDLHRDSLTYFAATFTAMDGYNLRRSLGRRMDMLVDAIVEEPLTMVVPRHLLGSNSTTSYEFCSLLLDYLIDRMDLLGNPNRTDIIFVDEHDTGNDVSEENCLKATIHAITQRPQDSIQRHHQRTATLVQLFERVLKSLAVYPDNEVIVRKHLRFIITFCLRASFENTSEWPESYPMLLRYVFRAISAGKFDDSYRELLSLIPTVLNGLCRVVTSAEDSVLRNTAIELCLTIPARLSSLLPHMNLLLRIIIPALDSNSNELVNLGYVCSALNFNYFRRFIL